METKIYVRNLAKSTSLKDLNTLFAQAGEVLLVDLIKDRNSGEPKGFAFITMSAQSEADKAISLFNAYSLGDHELKVDRVNPKSNVALTREIERRKQTRSAVRRGSFPFQGKIS